jgi:hypothetical protein
MNKTHDVAGLDTCVARVARGLYNLNMAPRASEVTGEFLVACACKLFSVLDLLAMHCSKPNIDTSDISYMCKLSKLFLSIEPHENEDKTKTKVGQTGGAETTMASEYYGIDSHNYFASDTAMMGGGDDTKEAKDTEAEITHVCEMILNDPRIPSHTPFKDKDTENAFKFILFCNVVQFMKRTASLYRQKGISKTRVVTARLVRDVLRTASIVVPV